MADEQPAENAEASAAAAAEAPAESAAPADAAADAPQPSTKVPSTTTRPSASKSPSAPKMSSSQQADAASPQLKAKSAEVVGEVKGAPSTKFTEDKSRKSGELSRIPSRARQVLGSVISIRKGSGIEDSLRKTVRYANTYRLESQQPFNPEKVYKILKIVLDEAIENLYYDAEKCATQAKWASRVIRSSIKEFEFERYKLISYVSIGEKHCQDVFVTCRFLWDAERDRFAMYTTENTSVYAIAICFGIYYE